MRICLILACLLLSFPAFAAPGSISGIVTSVHDGDTFRIGKQSIRLWGVDAAELKQQGGTASRDILAALIKDQEVTCTLKGKSHKRLLGHCFVKDRDIGAYMAIKGMAFDVARYSHGYYRADEQKARANSAGLWSLANVEAPDHWRACHLPGYKTRPAGC